MSEYNKKKPYSPEAEQALLGVLLLNPEKVPFVLDLINEDCLYEAKHKYIFKAMKQLHQEGHAIDYVSVSSSLENEKLLSKIGNIDYLIELVEMTPASEYLETYIDLIKETALKREIMETASYLAQKGYDQIDVQSYLDEAEEKIFNLTQRKKTSDLLDLKNLLKEIKSKNIQAQQKKDLAGFSTGFENLDNITLGLKPEEFIIIAARPSMGKSTFMINLALNVANSKYNSQSPHVAIFSLEMSNEQLAMRMLSSVSKVEHKKIQLSRVDKEDKLILEIAIDKMNKLNIYFDDSATVNILDIKAKCRKLKSQNKLDVVMIDYLQLIRKSQKTNRQEEVAEISQSLKQIARELKIPVIALSQLSRDVEKREDKRPVLSDLRDSGSIEQDADIVMFLYREDYYKKERNVIPGKVQVIIAKNRQGAVGVREFSLNFDLMLFTEIESYVSEN
ncbi:Replicative DNA helicase [Candidatus Phytoplasma australiense]|uniref:Replicative DNA helicase n=2 Tax=Phytoplasma australiense TaxID=59748 RepID=B1V951_PHYAS|nr:replicative DNA helicase [Candidatus Phytoplasma australiense]AGL90803.1 Replicative DNA helicase [Strawberry lethal yellows phytoplasma (CPA) str. NZSb11]CAM11483.1 Replicative DNA helicase [Candidatus Phytoplasma australiense]